MQKQQSPAVILGKISSFICSAAYFKRTGPLCRSAVKWDVTGAFWLLNSSVTTYLSRKLLSWPPYFFGHVIPIQPRAPTLLLNSLSKPLFIIVRWGSKPPLAISWARKSRTSKRSSSASRGSRIGSN